MLINVHPSKRVGVAAVLAILAFISWGGTPVAASDTAADEGRRAVIEVKGLACPFCAYGLEKHLRKLSGVTNVRIEVRKSEAVIELSPEAEVTEKDIRQAVRKAGLTAGAIEWKRSDEPDVSR